MNNMENILKQEKPTFRDWLKEAVDSGRSASLRADPIITSTDTDIVEKTVFGGIDVLTSPAEAFLRQLGVQFFSGLNGQFVVPAMAQSTGKFVAENQDASSASLSTTSLTLTPRRVSHSQAISKETLVQTSPGIYNGIIQNLVNGVWNCVTNDVFDQVLADCPSTNENSKTTYVTWTNLVDMEASLGDYMLTSPAYVVTPATRAYLSTTAKMTNQGPIYDAGKINSYPAYAVPAQNTSVITFADWNKVCVGQWGGLEIIVDPYTDAKKGLINLTIVGMFDSGVYNTLGVLNLYDPSVA